MINKYLKSLLSGGAPEVPEKSPLDAGMAAFEAGQFDAALPLLEEALALDGTHVPALVAVARIRLDLGLYAEALEPLKVSRELDARNPQVYYLLGELAGAQGDLVASEKNFRRATELDADFTDAHIRLGMVLTEQRRLAEATKAFERAIFLDRMAVVARYHLAQVCIESEDYQRALGQLHMVKELHPDYAPVYVLQGDIFQRLGDHRQAVVEFSKAIELGAGDATIYYRLGRSHLTLKFREKALRAFVSAIEQDPELWPAVYHAAVLHEELKRFAQAQRYFQSLVAIDEYREVATAAVERIGNVLAEIAASMAGDDAAPTPIPPPSGASGTAPLGSSSTRPL